MPTWRIRASIPIPSAVEADPDAGMSGGIPNALRRVQRLVGPSEATVRGIRVRVTPWDGARVPQLESEEVADLSVWTDAASPDAAIEAVTAVLEDVLDNLRFRTQQPLVPVQLEVINVTPPVQDGDERDGLLYPYPQGFVPSTYFATNQLPPGPIGSTQVTIGSIPTPSRRVRAALLWFTKSLHAAYDADRFILLWIALELLWHESDVRVSAPYVAPCQHEIPVCPECSTPTDRPLQGAGLKAYLSGSVGLTEDDARKLWRMRQLMHGEVDLRGSDRNELGPMTHQLRAAIGRVLKANLGIPDSEPPYFETPTGAIGPIRLGFRRAITDADIN